MPAFDSPPAAPQNGRARQEVSMRTVRVALMAAVAAFVATALSAQTSHAPRSPRPDPSGSPTATPPAAVATPAPVEGLVLTLDVRATAPALKAGPGAAPEAQVMASRLKGTSSLTSRVWLAQDLSRQEVLSTDFVLPAGTLVMHKAGDKFYVIADPRAKSYVVMDSQALLDALEGSAGVLNTQYEARVSHTDDRKTIAGLPCRKSYLEVTYVSSIPFENSRVAVQQKNEIEVWHTSSLVSSAALDHFFFKYQQDKTGVVQRTVSTEIGFPMEVSLVVTQGTGKKSEAPAPGSLHLAVTEVKKEPRLDPELFRIPPAGFRRTDKNPYFTGAK
jgi:hypothetical protein